MNTAPAQPLHRDPDDILALASLDVVYSGAILALSGVSLQVPRGAMVALLGPNGAGKTTTLKAVSNLIALERGRVSRGTIRYKGREIQGRPPEALVKAGIAQVLEGRRCFPNLTVEENLAVPAHNLRARPRTLVQRTEEVYGYFENLTRHRKTRAGLLSGGEQQMLAIARALLVQPDLLLLDEPSMGLAPQIVAQIFTILRALNRDLGLSILVAEQNARIALKHADHGYVLGNGTVVKSGPAAELVASEDIQRFYLGLAGAEAQAETAAVARGSPDWLT